MSETDGFHSLAEARSWALHEEVAVQLGRSPELVRLARQRVAGWLTDPAEHPYAAEWHTLLQQPLDSLRRALTDKGERMCTLRQASPFAGALDAKARWRILKRPEIRSRETG